MKKRFMWVLNNFENVLAACCSGLMVLLLLLQVISRYVFRHSIPWTEELAILSFILFVYFGAAGATRAGKHLRMDFVTQGLSPKGKLICKFLSDIVFLVFSVIISTGLYKVMLNFKRYKLKTAVTMLPKWIFYGVLPLCFIIIALRLIPMIIAEGKALWAKDYSSVLPKEAPAQDDAENKKNEE